MYSFWELRIVKCLGPAVNNFVHLICLWNLTCKLYETILCIPVRRYWFSFVDIQNSNYKTGEKHGRQQMRRKLMMSNEKICFLNTLPGCKCAMLNAEIYQAVIKTKARVSSLEERAPVTKTSINSPLLIWLHEFRRN
jgi:hypothetical protein